MIPMPHQTAHARRVIRSPVEYADKPRVRIHAWRVAMAATGRSVNLARLADMAGVRLFAVADAGDAA